MAQNRSARSGKRWCSTWRKILVLSVVGYVVWFVWLHGIEQTAGPSPPLPVDSSSAMTMARSASPVSYVDTTTPIHSIDASSQPRRRQKKGEGSDQTSLSTAAVATLPSTSLSSATLPFAEAPIATPAPTSEASSVPQVASGRSFQTDGGVLTVVLAAGLGQLDGALVVINSAVAHASDITLLHFRMVTLAEDAEALVDKLRMRLPRNTNLEAVAFDPWVPRVSRLLGGKSSNRAELFDALNFAAFYMHELFPKLERVLYLDTDVVVLTDLAKELSGRSLDGQPAGVAQDCSQRLGKYIDLDKVKKKSWLKEIPLTLQVKKKSCVINRGVVLIDIARWAAQNITEAITALVRIHLGPLGPLWRSGVSQPPFLLTIVGRYHDLGVEFNVRGLGRGDIAPEEVDHYKKKQMWNSYFDQFLKKCEINCCAGCKGWALTPHISPIANHAKILHFNGRLKPSKVTSRVFKPMPPPPKNLNEKDRSSREQTPLCSCGASCLQPCAALWWKYMPPQMAE